MRVRVVGRGRAGGSFSRALAAVGMEIDMVGGRSDRIAADDVDLVLLCVPDDAIGDVADRVAPGGAVVAHCAGSRTLAELGVRHARASIHPLMSLPDVDRGAARLRDACTFAVAGDAIARRVVDALGGRAIEVPDEDRVTYHAAACVAANHLAVLCAQVERLAELVDVPSVAYWTMMRHTLANVEQVGAQAALTGPAARGDTATIEAHLGALPEVERRLYSVMAEAAADLAGHPDPRRDR